MERLRVALARIIARIETGEVTLGAAFRLSDPIEYARRLPLHPER
jgi:hypothetical protein